MATLFTRARIIILAAIMLMAAMTVVPAHSAMVTSLTDVATNQDAGTAANHTLSFTTPSGVSEGSTITITFDASFDTSSLTEDDVDVADDSVNLTTAVNCSGVEEASVAISSDVVTITICAGDGGAIAGGSVVSVEIGSNATSSGTGLNQVTNPSSVGTYSIRLAGSFTDVGNVWVPIITTGGLPVSATIPSTGGGDGGPTGGLPSDTCTDSVFPTISDVTVTSVTSSGASINWQTDENASSEVDYGLSSSYGTTETAGVTQFHTVSLSGLSEGTVYHFRVRSEDGCPNESISGDFVFTTTDTTAPVISNVVVSNITTTSAVISWTTNELTTGVVSFSLGLDPASLVSSLTLSLSHSVTLSGLSSGASYAFFVTTTDNASNKTSSSSSSFTTLTDLPPGNVNGLTAAAGDTNVTLSWSLPSDSDLASLTLVWRTDRFPTSFTDGNLIGLTVVSSYLHTGRTNGVTYFYGLFVHDNSGQTSSGSLASATPTASSLEVVEEPAEELPEETEDGETDSEETDSEEPEPVAGEETPTEGSSGETEDSTTGGEGTPLGGTSTGGAIVCGNMICEAGETASSCPLDCDLQVIPPTTTAGGTLTQVRYLVAMDKIELFPGSSGNVLALPGRALRIVATIQNVPEGYAVQLLVGTDRYLMLRSGDIFSATITTPLESGAVQVRLQSLFSETTYTLAGFLLQLEPFGFTFETVEGERERLGYARTTLFTQRGGIFSPWDAALYGQLNPQTTPQNGTFAWYVPQGTYYVSASANGYRPTQTTQRFVTNAIVTEYIELRREPPSISEVITSPAPLLEKLSTVAGIFSDRTVQAIQIARGNPDVQQGVTVATPIVLATSLASTLVLSLSFDLLPFLQYLLTSPVLLLWRRRRKRWGTVYDGVSKQPIDLAIVRLYRLVDGRLVQSRVTDRYGRYFFLVDPGTYRMGITKAGFSFPSEFLKGQRQDGGFLDLYHGEVIEVSDQHATISANVPLDPISTGAQHAPLRIRAKRVLRSVQHLVAGVGIVVALIILVLRPGLYTAIVCGVQLLAYLLVRRLAKPARKPRGWGIVYEEETKKPLVNVVVRIFEPVYNKLLATAVTDKKGRYSFLVGPSTYYARFGKPGYLEQEIKPIDLSTATEPTDVAIDVSLKKIDG